MISIKKITGIANVNDSSVQCTGNIEILNVDRDHLTAYVSWKVFDNNGRPLASKSRNFFLQKKEFTEADIFEAVRQNILNYRIGRSHIFFEINII